MRYVTNEQRRRQTHFKPTLWAVASWLIFCPPRPDSLLTSRTSFALAASMQISRIAKLVRDARRSRLEKQPTDPASAGRNQRDLGDGTLGLVPNRHGLFAFAVSQII
jgi:hypothetical protein